MVAWQGEVFCCEGVDEGVEFDDRCGDFVGDESFGGCAYSETAGGMVRNGCARWKDIFYGGCEGDGLVWSKKTIHIHY